MLFDITSWSHLATQVRAPAERSFATLFESQAPPQWSQLETSAAGGEGTPIATLLMTVFSSILEVFIICFAGWYLAKKDIIDKRTQKQLNRLNVSLFTPCLLFSKVAFALSPQKLKELWIIPIFFVVVSAVSALVAWVCGHLLRLKRTQRNFAIAAAMFNNSNSLPIALMQSLVITVKGLKWDHSDTKDSMLGRALTYLVLYSTLGMMLRWSYGVHLLSQADDEIVPDGPEDGETSPLISAPSVTVTSHQDVPTRSESSSTLSSTTEEPPKAIARRPQPLNLPVPQRRQSSKVFYSFPNTPTRSVERIITAVPSRSNLYDENDDEWGGLPAASSSQPVEVPKSSFRTFVDALKRRSARAFGVLYEFMTVPMWAACASLVVACIRPFQHALEAHMQPVKGSLVNTGNCSIPITLLVLGAYFYTPSTRERTQSLTSALEASSSQHSARTSDYGSLDDDDQANRKAKWRRSDLSLITLKESLRDAFKFGSSKARSRGARAEIERKGETKTVLVAIFARMIITPAILLPCFALLAIYDLHKVTDDPVFVVSTVLLISSPPALTLAQITQAASGDAFERLISRTIFWSYCIFTPPLTILYVVIGLYMSKL